MSVLYVRLAGLAFFLVGAGWVGTGLYVAEPVIWLSGGFTAAAGIALMGVAPKLAGDNAS